MRKYCIAIFLMLLCLGGLLVHSGSLVESAAPSPQLIITQVKMTTSNGQFITIYNNTAGTIDLSSILLQYYNNYDLLKATSGKLISLSGKVPGHGYFVVNDGPLQACYQMVVDSVSLGLSSTAGMLQISHFSSTSSPQSIGILDDYVGWSKTAAAGAQTLPASTSAYLQRQPLDSQNAPIVPAPGSGTWISAQQPDGSTLCSFASTNVATGPKLLSSSSSPPSTVLSATTSSDGGMPAADAGLIAPQLSEVLPNPVPPQSDAADEFIELYNPNASAFDLSGFMLRTGTTTFHNFVFSAGQFILQPHEFRAFYAPQTGLTLTNDSGQAALLDPSGNMLAQTDVYSAAKDGYAWVYAQGLWQWTTTPTPNAANIITSPPVSTSTKAASTAKSKAGATSTKSVTKKTKAPKTRSAKSASTFSSPAPVQPANLHPLVLAGIGTLAVVYALYEYRHDLANNLYRFRRYRAARRTAG